MKIKSDNHICIGSNLKKIREKRGFMQADVIRELQLRGYSIQKQNYSRIEKEQEHIPASILYELHHIKTNYAMAYTHWRRIIYSFLMYQFYKKR